MRIIQTSATSNNPSTMSSTEEMISNVLDLHSNLPSRCERNLKRGSSATVWFFGLLSVLALFLVVQGKVSGGPAVSVLLLVMAIGITLIKGSGQPSR